MKSALVSLVIAVAAALGPSRLPDTPTGVHAVRVIRVPHGGIQPEAIVANGVLHLLYFAGEPRNGNLFYVRSPDYGSTFPAPVRVNSQDGSAIATGTIRGGHIAIGRSGRVHVSWNGSDTATPRGLANPSGQPTAPFLFTRSNVEGTGFEPQRNLTRRSYELDGGGSVAADEVGNVYAAWHGVAVGGPTGEDHRRMWVARSRDDGATFSAEESAWSEPTGACGCCGVGLLAARPSSLYLLYRSATSVTHRDMFLLASRDRGQSFRGSRVQDWNIGVCPMTSMSLVASGSRVLGAWETAGQVYFGEIDSDAARITTPIAAPGEASGRKHPRLAADADGRTLLVWTEGTAWARGGSLAWQVYDRSVSPVGASGTAQGVPMWSFAAPIVRPDGSFVVIY